MSFPTFSDVAFSYGQNVTLISSSRPANTTAQMQLIFVRALFDGTSAPTVPAPSGWSAGPSAGIATSGSYLFLASFYKAGDGSTSQVTVDFSGRLAFYTELQVAVYNTVNQSAPINASNTASNFALTNIAPSASPSVANTLLVCAWGQVSTELLDPPIPMVDRLNQVLLGFADEVRTASGATGTRTRSHRFAGFTDVLDYGVALSICLAPHPGPSIPVVTSPTSGLKVTQGATVTPTWNAASSPTAAQSSLKYKPQYSPNNGVDWFNILGGDGLTAAGATSVSWNTTGLTTGTGYKFRVIAYDPALAIYSLDYGYSGTFSVVAETAPAAPTGLSPATTFPAQNKASLVRLAWTLTDAIGNPQTEATVQWSRDGFASHTATIVVSGASQFTDVNFAGEAAGTTISFKVKRRGVSLYSNYSPVASFVVASAPATPNITSPTAGAPPTTPRPTIQFTESDAFVARRTRVVKVSDSSQLHDSGTVSSTALSFVLSYDFQAGVQVDLFHSVQNVYGLWSAEDSERFTPSYSPPAQPTITATADSVEGHILISITNPASPPADYNDIYASDAKHALHRIATGVAKNGTFQDHNVPSGVLRTYFARAIVTATLMATDSATDADTLALTLLHIHAVTKTNAATNADGAAVALINNSGYEKKAKHKKASHRIAGRGVVTVYGQMTAREISAGGVIIAFADESQLADLVKIFKKRAVTCVRDHAGNILFGKVAGWNIEEQDTLYRVSFKLDEQDHDYEV